MTLLCLCMFTLHCSPVSASSVWRSEHGDIFKFEKRGVVNCSFKDGQQRVGKWKWDQRHSKITYRFRGESKSYYVFIQGNSANVYFGARDFEPTKWNYVESRGANPEDDQEGWFMAVPGVPRPSF